MKRMVVAILAWTLVAPALAEDTLKLKDGQVIHGTILAITPEDVQIQTASETVRVPNWAIDTVERETPPGGTPVTAETKTKQTPPHPVCRPGSRRRCARPARQRGRRSSAWRRRRTSA
jgi:hypothetical protein